MSIIIGVDNMQYKGYRKVFSGGKHNGAYYYAKEIDNKDAAKILQRELDMVDNIK